MSDPPSSSVSTEISTVAASSEHSTGYSWSLPQDGKCYYPNIASLPELDFTRSCRRLFISTEARREWSLKAMGRSFLEDRTLYEGLENGLVEVPLDPSQPHSLRNSMTYRQLNNTRLEGAEYYVLSYVHQAATSTYGLAKLPEPAERELIDGIRRRAKINKSSRVFIWSDQTIKGRVSDDVWLKVGVYAYAVLPGIIVPTVGYTDRLWPLVEYSLLEACSGFIIDVAAAKQCENVSSNDIELIAGENIEWMDDRRSISCSGRGNTIRNGLCMMATLFLTTQLGNLDTHFHSDRTFLRDVSVSLLKGDRGRSIGHHLLCPETCEIRQVGGLANFVMGVSTRALHRGNNANLDFDQSCALWGSSTLSIPSLSVFRSKGGFMDNIIKGAVSSAWRSLMKVAGSSEFHLALRNLSSKFQFSSTHGYIGTLYVLNFRFNENQFDESLLDQPYWSAPSVLAWIELEADSNGNQNWPGASMRLDQVSTAEIECLMRIHKRFWGEERIQQKHEKQIEMLRRNMIQTVSTLLKNDFTRATLLQLSDIQKQRRKSIIHEEVMDIIGQEIEKHAMVQNTGKLQLANVVWKMPYDTIEKVDGELKLSITRSTNEKRSRNVVNGNIVEGPPDPRLTLADYWIYLGNENAKELIGMGGRICMFAALAGVGSEAVINFIEKENLRGSKIEENRGVGKKQSCKHWHYMKRLDGNWKRIIDDCDVDGEITGDQLPRHAIVGGWRVQEMYA